MTREPAWRRYARLWGPDVRADIEDELHFHIETRAAEHVAQGVPPDEARERARTEFGDLESARRQCRAIDEQRLRRGRRAARSAGWRSDLRLAWRAMHRRPAFAAVVILTLALGLGTNTAIFAVVHGVLLRPLPYAMPEQLVSLWPDHFISTAEQLFLQEHMRSAAAVESYSPGWSLTLTGVDEPTQLAGSRVSSGFFNALGVRPALGRAFTPEDARLSSNDVAILSHSLWRTRFGADSSIVGRRIILDGTPHTVVGVMPERFWFHANDVPLWLPFAVDPASPFHREASALGIARLQPGAEPAQAAAEMRALVGPMRETFAFEADYGRDVDVIPLRDALVGRARTPLLVLFGAVLCIVLIAVANVGNLLLVRTAERRREVAVRSALGAGRGRIVRQLIVESVALATVAGALAVVIGIVGIRLLSALLPPDLPRVHEIAVSPMVLAVSAALTLAIGVLIGLVPAMAAVHVDPEGALRARTDDRGAVGGRRLRAGLVIVEVGLAFTLMAGAGLMVRTLWSLSRVDPGFRPARAITLMVSPSGNTVARRQYMHDVMDRLRAMPGIAAVGATHHPPLSGFSWNTELVVDGRPQPPGSVPPRASWRIATDDYFRAMEIPLREGRSFAAQDHAEAPRAVIVNERLARQLWPGESAVGRRLQAGFATMQEMATVVGVVGDVRHDGLTSEPPAELYVSMRQRMAGPMHLVVRGEAEAPSPAAVRDVVQNIDPNVPIVGLRTMNALVAASVSQQRLVMTLLLVLGALGLALGAIGVYGVVSYTVGQRTHEIGVRMALGADWHSVARLILGGVVRIALAGVAIGVTATLLLSGALRSLVYGVTVTDPATYAALGVALILIVLLAGWLPARRATRVDPAVVLRAD